MCVLSHVNRNTRRLNSLRVESKKRTSSFHCNKSSPGGRKKKKLKQWFTVKREIKNWKHHHPSKTTKRKQATLKKFNEQYHNPDYKHLCVCVCVDMVNWGVYDVHVESLWYMKWFLSKCESIKQLHLKLFSEILLWPFASLKNFLNNNDIAQPDLAPYPWKCQRLHHVSLFHVDGM